MLRETPCLWDRSCGDYKIREKKKEQMQRLADKYKLSYSDMEKKLHSLKTQFRREYKKLRESQRSGSSPEKCGWFGYEPLRFLLRKSESRGERCSGDGKSMVSTFMRGLPRPQMSNMERSQTCKDARFAC